MSKVRPDPVMEKADLSSMTTEIAGAPTGTAIVTEDGPVRGTNVFGVIGYLGIPLRGASRRQTALDTSAAARHALILRVALITDV